MHADEIHSIYRQYKLDTDSVVSWLASTAERHGYLFDHSSSAPSYDTGRANPNGKGRRKKKADPTISDTARNSEPRKQVITTAEFIQLALFIANSSPIIPVPGSFIKTINRVITLRSSFSRVIREQQDVRDVESDESHDHFVDTLKSVRDILYRPDMEDKASPRVVSPERSPAEPKPDQPKDSGSRFAPIFMDESESPQDLIAAMVKEFVSSERPKVCSDTRVIYVAETQTSFNDSMFVCLALILDLNHIRSYVKEFWALQKRQDLDPAIAAVVTNIAISLGRGIIEEAEQVLNKSDLGSIGLIRRIYGMRFFRTGVNDADLDRFSDCYGMYERAEWAFIAPMRILTGCQTLVRGKLNPRSHFDCMDATGLYKEWNTKTDLEKFEADELILTQYWCDMIFLLRNMPNFPIEDQVFCSIREMNEAGGKLTMSAVFASQIFLDIYHVVQLDARYSFSHVYSCLVHMEQSLNFWLLRPQTYSNETGKLMTLTLDTVQIFLEDHIFTLKKNIFKAKENQPSQFRTFRYCPVLSGLFLFHLRNQMRVIALSCMGSWDTTLKCIHLYNALLQEGMLEDVVIQWPDVERTISVLGYHNIWLGSQPLRNMKLIRAGSYTNYLRNYFLKKGISTTTLNNASKANYELLTSRKTLNRELAIEPTLTSQFPSQTFLPGPTTNGRPSRPIEGFPAEYQFRWNAIELQRTLTLKTPESKKEKKGRKRGGRSDQAGSQQKQAKKVLQSADLLKELAVALQAESSRHAFPLLWQHATFQNILERLYRKCETMMPRGVFLTERGTKRSDIDIVGLIFLMSNETEDPRYLQGAAEVFKDWITECGQIPTYHRAPTLKEKEMLMSLLMMRDK